MYNKKIVSSYVEKYNKKFNNFDIHVMSSSKLSVLLVFVFSLLSFYWDVLAASCVVSTNNTSSCTVSCRIDKNYSAIANGSNTVTLNGSCNATCTPSHNSSCSVVWIVDSDETARCYDNSSTSCTTTCSISYPFSFNVNWHFSWVVSWDCDTNCTNSIHSQSCTHSNHCNSGNKLYPCGCWCS